MPRFNPDQTTSAIHRIPNKLNENDEKKLGNSIQCKFLMDVINIKVDRGHLRHPSTTEK